MRKNKALFDAGWWWLSDEAAGSFHPGGVNVSMADGSVRFIKDTISCWPNDVANFGPDIQWSADGELRGRCGHRQTPGLAGTFLPPRRRSHRADSY